MPVLAHRIITTPEAQLSGISAEAIVNDVVDRTSVPKRGCPRPLNARGARRDDAGTHASQPSRSRCSSSDVSPACASSSWPARHSRSCSLTGFVLVWARGDASRVQRTVTPTRTTVGRPVRVELAVDATGRLGLGPVLLAGQAPARGRPVAASRAPRRHAGDARHRAVAYTVAPRMRGRHAIGPLEVTHTDPFGAVRRRVRTSPGTSPLARVPVLRRGLGAAVRGPAARHRPALADRRTGRRVLRAPRV